MEILIIREGTLKVALETTTEDLITREVTTEVTAFDFRKIVTINSEMKKETTPNL